MRIGLMVGATAGPGGTLDGLVATAKRYEAAGFPNLWMANIFGLDAINALGIVGRETTKIELGTAVVPTYPRHPVAIAQQGLTTQAASRGRFLLGIGLSHKLVIENMLGMSYEKPAKHMREYLQVLGPLCRGEGVQFQGEQYRVAAQLQVPGATPLPVLVAALGPTMLRLTGELADGTITWMTGPKTLAAHIAPTLRQAAKAAGRPEPRFLAGYPHHATTPPGPGPHKLAHRTTRSCAVSSSPGAARASARAPTSSRRSSAVTRAPAGGRCRTSAASRCTARFCHFSSSKCR